MTRKPWLTAAALAVLAATAAQAHDANRPSALVVSGRVIDGSGAAPIIGGRVVAVDGVITCVVAASAQSLTIDAIEISGRGVSFATDEELMSDAQRLVRSQVEKQLKAEGLNIDSIRKNVRNSLSNFLWNKTHTRPMVIPVVMEV